LHRPVVRIALDGSLQRIMSRSTFADHGRAIDLYAGKIRNMYPHAVTVNATTGILYREGDVKIAGMIVSVYYRGRVGGAESSAVTEIPKPGNNGRGGGPHRTIYKND
jgi:hypothetical protein